MYTEVETMGCFKCAGVLAERKKSIVKRPVKIVSRPALVVHRWRALCAQSTLANCSLIFSNSSFICTTRRWISES